MAIVSAATVRDYVPSISGAGSDTLIDTLISRFDQLAAAHLGFLRADSGEATVEVRTFTEYFDEPVDGEGGRELLLSVRPVVSQILIGSAINPGHLHRWV